MKTYKSKISLGIILLVVISPAWALYVCVINKEWVTVILILMSFLTVFYLFLNTIYTIEKENLNVRFGFLVNKNIDIKTIRKISETYNPVSSPAASIDRLEIMYNKYDTVLVSPKDKKGFIDSLTEINPNIEVVYRKNKQK